LATTSHVGIREFNCGIILTGTSVRYDPYPVTEVEAEITCPTFSDDIGCATQAETFTELECTMTAECTPEMASKTEHFKNRLKCLPLAEHLGKSSAGCHHERRNIKA